VTSHSSTQGCRRSRWFQESFGEPPLAFDGQSHDMRLFNGAMGGFLRGCDDKIAYRAPLQLGCALEHVQDFRRHPRFEASGSMW